MGKRVSFEMYHELTGIWGIVSLPSWRLLSGWPIRLGPSFTQTNNCCRRLEVLSCVTVSCILGSGSGSGSGDACMWGGKFFGKRSSIVNWRHRIGLFYFGSSSGFYCGSRNQPPLTAPTSPWHQYIRKSTELFICTIPRFYSAVFVGLSLDSRNSMWPMANDMLYMYALILHPIPTLKTRGHL